jgi:hypothetical protein
MEDSLFISSFSEMTGDTKNAIKVIQKILIFTILVVVLDFVVGSGLEYLYFKQKVGLYARTTYGLEQTTAELLIFGSSSANHHYNPAIFEETLNLSAYNEGRDGIEILYHSAIMKGILRRYTPKIVILNLAPNELSTELGYDRLSSLLPYYEKYPEMKEIISLRSGFENWKLLSKIYPYNSTFLTIINGIHRMTGKRIQDKGYVPIFGSIDTFNFNEEAFVNYQLDKNRVKGLVDFVDQCKKRKILLYLVFSPIFSFNNQETETITEAKRISKEKGILCYNFINDPRFNCQASLFKDNGHMNQEGATLFSKIMANNILADLEKAKSTASLLP